ncbi:unnamed protein product, partial [Lymnaea stagnalis]
MKAMCSENKKHEASLSFKIDVGPLQSLANCYKNPGHSAFIDAGSFTVADLPVGVQKSAVADALFQLIESLISLTVRVAVSTTSPGRPSFFKNTSTPYPFHDKRGSYEKRLGTGRIQDVEMFTADDRRPCKCPACRKNSTPALEWGTLYVTTARHVVFDQHEAQLSVCRLFFDAPESNGTDVRGEDLRIVDEKVDKCLVLCISHDTSLLQKLSDTLQTYRRMDKKVQKISKKNKASNRTCVIVSHPHGCSKHITFGRWTHSPDGREGGSCFYHTSATCPGSSGAPVYILGSRIG